MGEARKKSRKRAEILAGGPRCIYCTASAETVEHMPPTGVFTRKDRPSGLEFPACQDCNELSRVTDAAAAFFARISPSGFAPEHELEEAYQLIGTLRKFVPKCVDEIFDPKKSEEVWARGRDPIATKKHIIKLDGPVTHALMSAFTGKLGMALFHEHTGQPLPETGAVFTQFYFNTGLNQRQADLMFEIMPLHGNLKQGRKTSGKQFEYRYNTDENDVLFALASFRQNLFVRCFAASQPDSYRSVFEGEYNSNEVELGFLRELSSQWN